VALKELRLAIGHKILRDALDLPNRTL